MIRKITSREEFEGLKEQWNILYNNIEYKTPFQSFCFNYNSWNLLENEVPLYILCFYRKKGKADELYAIFPFVLTKKGVLQFINCIHSDFCGALILEDVRKDYFMYKNLCDYIKENDEIKGFMFNNLKEDNYLVSVMQYFFNGMHTHVSSKWSYFHVKGKKDAYDTFIKGMPQLSAKDRANMKRYKRQMELMQLKLYKQETEEYPSEIVNDIVDDMLKTGIRIQDYFSETFKELIYNLYKDGGLTIAVTSKENEVLSANLYFIEGSEYINWLSIYKNRNFNSLNLVACVEHIYSHGGGILNFARGIYDYKVRNFRPEIHNLYKIQYSKSIIGQIKDLISVYKYNLKVMLKPIIRKK